MWLDEVLHVIPVGSIKQSFLISHETFHQFGLDDLEKSVDKGNLMYHLNDNGQNGVNQLSPTQIANALRQAVGYPTSDALQGSHQNRSTGVLDVIKDEGKFQMIMITFTITKKLKRISTY